MYSISDMINWTALPEVTEQAKTNAKRAGELAVEYGDACGLAMVRSMVESELHMVSVSLAALRDTPDSLYAAGAVHAYEHEAHALQRILLVLNAWEAGRTTGA